MIECCGREHDSTYCRSCGRRLILPPPIPPLEQLRQYLRARIESDRRSTISSDERWKDWYQALDDLIGEVKRCQGIIVGYQAAVNGAVVPLDLTETGGLDDDVFRLLRV